MTGRPITFALAVTAIVIWAVTGPLFHFSDTWQLVINTSTTIVTFLMVFLIQNTQDRDTQALHVKLDELIRATQGAHNALLALEELDEGQLNRLRTEYESLGRTAQGAVEMGRGDTDVPVLEDEDRSSARVTLLPAPPQAPHTRVHDEIVNKHSQPKEGGKQRMPRNRKTGNR